MLYEQLLVAINHPVVQQNLSTLVINVLNREDVKSSATGLTSDVFTSQQVTDVVKKVLGDAVISEYVKQCSVTLGKQTTNAVLNDPNVRKSLSGCSNECCTLN